MKFGTLLKMFRTSLLLSAARFAETNLTTSKTDLRISILPEPDLLCQVDHEVLHALPA
jgi:hypothetical protein